MVLQTVPEEFKLILFPGTQYEYILLTLLLFLF